MYASAKRDGEEAHTTRSTGMRRSNVVAFLWSNLHHILFGRLALFLELMNDVHVGNLAAWCEVKLYIYKWQGSVNWTDVLDKVTGPKSRLQGLRNLSDQLSWCQERCESSKRLLASWQQWSMIKDFDLPVMIQFTVVQYLNQSMLLLEN